MDAGLSGRGLRSLRNRSGDQARIGGMLPTLVLRLKRGAAMRALAAPNDWKNLDGMLRPFVERRMAVAADVDDVLQEIFLRVQRGLAGLRDEQRFGPWLFAVA